MGNNIVGGVVGFCNNESKIEKCYNKADIKKILYNDNNEGSVAGIVGNCGFNSLIISCYNVGIIDNEGDRSGGIAGVLSNGGNLIKNCYNYGEIRGGKYYLSNYTGCKIGGIVGCGTNSYDLPMFELENCYNLGKVKTKKSATYSFLGGILGTTQNGHVKLNYCYNSGNIDYTIKSTHNDVGGIAGAFNDTTGILSNLYTTYSNIIGQNTGNATITNGNPNYSNMPSILSVVNAGGQNEFVNDVTPNINGGKPILKWQKDKMERK